MSSESDSIIPAIIYGSIATVIVSLLSLSGACVLPLVTGDSRQRWMQFFIAMAVSTLTSDAFLHLIPEILGLHSHSSHEHDHKHEHEHESHEHGELTTDRMRTKRHAREWMSVTEERIQLLWLSLVLLAIYCVYFFEFVVFFKKRHVHHPEKVAHCPAHDEQRIDAGNSMDSGSSRSEMENEVDEEARCCGLTGRAMVILVGDAVHNLVDGVAIGSSFLVSPQLGLVTSIAVICHELPHELGDLAVLLDSGISMSRALLLNLISALTAFIGLFLAFAVGRNEMVERALLALTAGMFLYVALVDMLSHLKHNGPTNDHWLFICCLQFAGFVVGFTVIFSIGWFEHDLFH